MNLVDAVVTKVISETVEKCGEKEYTVYEVEYDCWGRKSIGQIRQPLIREGHRFLV